MEQVTHTRSATLLSVDEFSVSLPLVCFCVCTCLHVHACARAHRPPPHASFICAKLSGNFSLFAFSIYEKLAGGNINNCNSSPVLCTGCVHTRDFSSAFTSLSPLLSPSCSGQDARKCRGPPGDRAQSPCLPGGRHCFMERSRLVSPLSLSGATGQGCGDKSCPQSCVTLNVSDRGT